MRSSKDATVFGSLLIKCVSSRCVTPLGSDSSKLRITVNWSGVTSVCAMRRRNAWFKLYHARRSNGGKRRRTGESISGWEVSGAARTAEIFLLFDK